jgi:hypothetical protein
MTRTTWKYLEVREAVAELVAGSAEDTSYIEVAPAYRDVMKRLNLDLTTTQVGGYAHELNRERDRLWAQVRRALDELTRQGQTVKVGRGMYHPSGAYEAAVSYYPAANFRRASVAAKEAFRAREDLDQSWAAVRSRLTGLGFAVSSTSEQPVGLDLDGWTRVLEMIEAGAL